MSDRQIAAQSTQAGRKVSHVAIGKHAAKEGWKKAPLTARVRREVERKLAEAAITTVTKNGTPAAAKEIVDAAARQGVEVIRQHRKSIGSTLAIADSMIEELKGGTTDQADLKAFVMQATEPAEGATAADAETLAQRRQRLMRMIGLQSRASILQVLSQSLRQVVGLERQAFNLNDQTATPDSIEARLANLDDA